MSIYRIVVTWEEVAEIDIEAESIAEAEAMFRKGQLTRANSVEVTSKKLENSIRIDHYLSRELAGEELENSADRLRRANLLEEVLGSLEDETEKLPDVEFTMEFLEAVLHGDD